MKIVLERAYKHLSNDKIMHFLIDKFQDKIDWGNRYNSNYALSIANLIIEQQISFRAAITIKSKFKKLIGGLSNSDIINLDTGGTERLRIDANGTLQVGSYGTYAAGAAVLPASGTV